MFDQPRTRRHEIIGRGLIEGLSGVFLGFIISLGFGLLLELDDGELSISFLHNFVLPVWLTLSTLYFTTMRLQKMKTACVSSDLDWPQHI